MPKLYVVRHAEPALTGVLLGRTDPPLSAEGQREAHGKLARLAVKAVYTSPLRRCLATAEAIDSNPIVLDDLAEIALGEWDGLSWAEIEKMDPDLARRKAADWFGVEVPGGERWPGFARRVGRALDVVLAGKLPAAVIGHVATNAVIAQRLTGEPPLEFNQRYCEIHEYKIRTQAED